jgi:hypothetical protein
LTFSLAILVLEGFFTLEASADRNRRQHPFCHLAADQLGTDAGGEDRGLGAAEVVAAVGQQPRGHARRQRQVALAGAALQLARLPR